MLSQEEVTERTIFYTDIFGERVVNRYLQTKPHLWSIQAYGEKIRTLAKHGFKDPQKMVASFPQILGLSFDNIDGKIRALTERGFKDPQKLIASFPSILGFSLANIDSKIRLCRRLGVKIDDFVAYTMIFIGMSKKHYLPILRKCWELGIEPTPKNVLRIYTQKSF